MLYFSGVIGPLSQGEYTKIIRRLQQQQQPAKRKTFKKKFFPTGMRRKRAISTLSGKTRTLHDNDMVAEGVADTLANETPHKDTADEVRTGDESLHQYTMKEYQNDDRSFKRVLVMVNLTCVRI
jgi:hypothetical protein